MILSRDGVESVVIYPLFTVRVTLLLVTMFCVVLRFHVKVDQGDQVPPLKFLALDQFALMTIMSVNS